MRLGPRRWGLGLGVGAGFWFSVFCFLFSGPWGRRPGWDRATGLGYGSGLVRFGQVWGGLRAVPLTLKSRGSILGKRSQ